MAEFVIKEENNVRLDRFIRREHFYLPQGIIEKYLRIGQIQVNGKKSKSSYRLKKGDIITINDSLRENAKKEKIFDQDITNFSPATIALANKIQGEYLIMDCDEFIAINKPYGLSTQGGSKINISVDHAISYLNKINKTSLRLVHRLDKDTSGVLIITKNLNSCTTLGAAFKTKDLTKIYLAIVFGVPNPKKGNIENYIGKDRSGSYDMVIETKDGKFAKTIYQTLATKGSISAIKYTPLTGRMHQIRFHTKQLGCQILGDMKYGNKPYDRMMLHALEISIPATIFGKEYVIKAPIDRFFKEFLNKLNLPIIN